MSTSAYTNTKYDAEGYQLFRPTYPDSLYEHLSSYISCTKPALAVDLGCGTGLATKALASKVAKVYGIDISQAMIKQAKEQPCAIFDSKWVRPTTLWPVWINS